MDMDGQADINRVDRSKVRLIYGRDEGLDFVNFPADERVSVIWELTRELWSLTGDTSAQQRLQRNVAVLKRQ